jgi:hypothetical protein
LTFLETLAMIFIFSIYVTPIIILIFGLIFYFKFPQWRLWTGVCLIIFCGFGLIAYLLSILAGMSRSYSYDIPLSWYVASFAQIASIILGAFA